MFRSMTLELDAATADVIEHLAHAWGVSKEEAVKRAVAEAEAAASDSGTSNAVDAFKQLQKRLKLTPEQAAAWQAAVHEARR